MNAHAQFDETYSLGTKGKLKTGTQYTMMTHFQQMDVEIAAGRVRPWKTSYVPMWERYEWKSAAKSVRAAATFMKGQPLGSTPLLDEWKSYYSDWPMGLTPYTRKCYADMIISDAALAAQPTADRTKYHGLALAKRKAAYRLKVQGKQSAYSLGVRTGVAAPAPPVEPMEEEEEPSLGLRTNPSFGLTLAALLFVEFHCLVSCPPRLAIPPPPPPLPCLGSWLSALALSACPPAPLLSPGPLPSSLSTHLMLVCSVEARRDLHSRAVRSGNAHEERASQKGAHEHAHAGDAGSVSCHLG